MSRTFRDPGKFTHAPNVDEYLKTCTWGWWCVERREQYVEEDRARFARYDRDGMWNESGRNQAFKELVRKDRRARDRAAIHKVLVGEEDVEFTCNKHGKRFIWSVW